MSYPYFTRGLPSALPSRRAEEVPFVARKAAEDPRGYMPHPDLSHAVNVALVLGMPLLVTGEPGTGKTQLAFCIADELKCPIWKFETKSTSVSRDLFYTYDAMSAFKAGEGKSPRDFIRYQALGRAIVEAFPRTNQHIDRLIPPGYPHPGEPRRSVVLIDEVDKAPRDFPNDLLNEIERLYFRVPELDNIGSPGADQAADRIPENYAPVIVLTSNSEKGLPDPFLRRCVYFHIPFPTREEMRSIVANRVEKIEASDPLLASALDLFYELRHSGDKTSLKKEPSTAELINWLQILVHRGAPRDQSLKSQQKLVLETLSTLVKNTDDRQKALEYAAAWTNSGT